MPRRAAALATPATSTPLTDGTLISQSDDPFASQVSLLRRQWKWAVFSQFFYTFATLFAMQDVSLTDIEDDLTRSTSIVIHRIMHRLLVAATQDRKLSLDTWQTALRKQYKKRDPDLNPIGPEPVVQLPTPAPDSPADPDDEEPKAESVSTPGPSSSHTLGNTHQPNAAETGDHDLKPGHSAHFATELKPEEMKLESMSVEDAPLAESAEESKDWLSLPMLTKLDSLHLLTEWQFHNVNRIRTIMRDDDETAQWRIEPIGYDSKANAYWLVGPDRLWIQRDTPKPPRNPKRKRAATKPKYKRPAIISDDESDTSPAPKKRKAVTTARSNTSRNFVTSPKTPTARSSRTRRPPSPSEDLGPITSRGPRAAKMQASAKLSVQAKELAELQRQAALEGRRSGKRVPTSPPRRSARRPMGTRVSARLWGDAQGDDEWQEIPDEWLNKRGEAEEDGGASGSERLDGEAEMGQVSDPDLRPEPELEAVPDPDTDAHQVKTGLESDDDDVSELTELTEISPPATVLVSHSNTKKARKKGAGSRRKTSRTKRRASVVEDSVDIAQPVEEVEPEEEIEPEWRPPEDFVEWETICVTLNDWEHICERFEGATHYTEKALYKLLSQHIAPTIIAELREAQQKRHMEEAVSQRKRSSRLAIKENEKEETRLAALRKAEEEEKLSRARRLEARQKREEEERMKREIAREKRRLDREERERRAQAGEEEEKTNASSSIVVVGDDPQQRKTPKAKPGRPRTKAAAPAVSSSASASGSRTPVGEDWVLDCEICHRSGVNKDDGSPLLCCGKCSKWQHIACHDLADRKAGRPKRDWDKEEFICRNCQSGRSLGIVANGSMRQVPNGSSSSAAAAPSYDAGRTPSPYYHHQTQTSGYAGQPPYGQNYLHPSLPHQQLRPAPYQHHTAITFSHYQPQQRGFTSSSHPSSPSHLQPAIPQAPTSYTQPHYSTHGSSSKLSQYPTAQYPSHIYSNGTSWPAPASASPSSSSPTPARSGANWSTHAQTTTTTTNYPTISSSSPSSSNHHSPSVEHSSMSGAGAAPYAATSPAQNGNTATANPSVAATMQSSRSWSWCWWTITSFFFSKPTVPTFATTT
ncbi:hypothetical protein F5888DRAFT_1232099 [Russula emetica]|nr:hypothetical protein F5888DRAFT_1232099 [Russula emetica]